MEASPCDRPAAIFEVFTISFPALGSSVVVAKAALPLDSFLAAGIAWSFVIVALAGRDLFDFVLPKVKASDDLLDGVGTTLSLIAEAVSMAVLLAEEILSRATCVIGAAFRGQVLLYHDDLGLDTSCVEQPFRGSGG